jgi:hypothetical protein
MIEPRARLRNSGAAAPETEWGPRWRQISGFKGAPGIFKFSELSLERWLSPPRVL